MKRIISIFTIAALAAATAALCAGFSFDAAVPQSGEVGRAFLADSPAVLAEVRLANLDPSNSTVSVSALHRMADGTVATNALAESISGDGVHSVTGATVRVLPGDIVRLKFSSATNGCCTVVLE